MTVTPDAHIPPDPRYFGAIPESDQPDNGQYSYLSTADVVGRTMFDGLIGTRHDSIVQLAIHLLPPGTVERLAAESSDTVQLYTLVLVHEC